MDTKTIILVIILSILIGTGIFSLPRVLTQNSNYTPTIFPSFNKTVTTTQPTATPLPTPNPITINEKSNLKEEINKLSVPNFDPDFTQLKEQIK